MIDHAVWKTPLSLVSGPQVMQLPIDAKALHVGSQDKNVCVWWLVDRLAVLGIRRLLLVGTGHPLTRDDLTYIGTTQQGAFVWHVFEVKP